MTGRQPAKKGVDGRAMHRRSQDRSRSGIIGQQRPTAFDVHTDVLNDGLVYEVSRGEVRKGLAARLRVVVWMRHEIAGCRCVCAGQAKRRKDELRESLNESPSMSRGSDELCQPESGTRGDLRDSRSSSFRNTTTKRACPSRFRAATRIIWRGWTRSTGSTWWV